VRRIGPHTRIGAGADFVVGSQVRSSLVFFDRVLQTSALREVDGQIQMSNRILRAESGSLFIMGQRLFLPVEQSKRPTQISFRENIVFCKFYCVSTRGRSRCANIRSAAN